MRVIERVGYTVSLKLTAKPPNNFDAPSKTKNAVEKSVSDP